MPTGSDYEYTKFNKPSDWDEWSEAYEEKAKHAGILDYVHPNRKLRKPWPTEPVIPQFDDFQKKQPRRTARSSNNNDDSPETGGAGTEDVNRNAARRRAAAARTGTSGRSQTAGRSQIESSNADDDQTPSTSDHEEEEDSETDTPKTTQFSHLTAIGQTDWKAAFELYKETKGTYYAKTAARSKFHDWILKSIGPNYRHITKGKDIPGIYQALKEQWLPFKRTINRDLGSEYSSHLNQIKNFERRLGDWAIRWQNLVSEGIEQKIPQIATPSSWYDDLTDALKEIRDGKTWAMDELAILEEDILEGNFSHNQVAARMQSAIGGKIKDNRKRGRIEAGFPVLHGKDADKTEESAKERRRRRGRQSKEEHQEVRQSRDTKENSPSRPSKKTRSNGDRCEVCLQHGHKLNKCYYTYSADEETPDWFEDSKSVVIEDRVAKMLEFDKQLAEKVKKARETLSASTYPLRNSAIVDSGTTIHIFNNPRRFRNLRQAPAEDFVYAGDTEVPILGYGEVIIKIKAKKDGSVLCELSDQYGQFVIEDVPFEAHSAFHAHAAFHTDRKTSWTGRPTSDGTGKLWHGRLGHPGAAALAHLQVSTTRARLRGPASYECPACGEAKAKRKIRRQLRKEPHKVGERFAIDFLDLAKSQKGFNSVMPFTDRKSGYVFDLYLTERKTLTLMAAINHFLKTMERQFGLQIKVIECDDELMRSKALESFWKSKGMRIERCAPNTQAQNGGAERSGGVIKLKAKAMRAAARLPEILWVEIYKAAVYLYNRTPKKRQDWRSPYEVFHTFLATRDGIPNPERKPQLAHLRNYGCRAYVMTTEAMLKKERLFKLRPNAWIGYLVGYESTNIYRIWSPKTNDIVRVRDCSLPPLSAENRMASDDLTTQEEDEETILDCIVVGGEDFDKMSEHEDSDKMSECDEPTSGPCPVRVQLRLKRLAWGFLIPFLVPPWHIRDTEHHDSGVEEMQEAPDPEEEVQEKEFDQYSSAILDPLLTPGNTPPPPTALFEAAFSSLTLEELQAGKNPTAGLFGSVYAPIEELRIDADTRAINTWQAAFSGGRHAAKIAILDGQAVDKHTLRKELDYCRISSRKRRQLARHEAGIMIAKESTPMVQTSANGKYDRRDLPPPPNGYKELKKHPLAKWFVEGMEAHMQSHREMKSFEKCHRSLTKNTQVLDCMWVYTYKLDKRGYLIKVKARLVVRGDQQAKITLENTYIPRLDLIRGSVDESRTCLSAALKQHLGIDLAEASPPIPSTMAQWYRESAVPLFLLLPMAPNVTSVDMYMHCGWEVDHDLARRLSDGTFVPKVVFPNLASFRIWSHSWAESSLREGCRCRDAIACLLAAAPN
ncbi:hypothetical protein CHGG_03457 [Chaetomium globosum CBS 148.51]|uniref:Integrase catalytic domain-containing protein n=1 Tax=Chaetomium globosum (strain ATCC 6205 / CBS 148.51 / DSM 1962 / NBRC 6347 / NRRL 1970) TaxID=306901 RepID=Q2H8J7_CHAGB|nr:uncharacterized protein CHGG_03457 [Chaetomium globosum CBS 148.51]EAQ91522.1 hypothetical protein CHGG_03457 [Chaetomium globosum CBS 148.51]